MIHPNYLNNLYKVLEDIYCDKLLMNDIIEKCFINPVIEIINENSKSKAIELFNKLKTSFDDFEITVDNLNIKNIYRFE